MVEDFGIELVLEAEAECGECPVWDARRQELLWVDIPRGLVHIYDPVMGSDKVFDLGQPVGSLARRAGGGMVVALAEGFGFFDEESGQVRRSGTILGRDRDGATGGGGLGPVPA